MKHGIAPQRSGGDVLVSASAANGRLTIEVSDTGDGLRPRRHSRRARPRLAGPAPRRAVRRRRARERVAARGPVRRADGAAAIMKLRAYLVDDEPLAIARLTRLLDETGRVEVIGSATDPEEAVEALASAPPDVCFLDIHMPRLNGFEVLARLPAQPIVVFTTAHDQYALDAFAVNSVDYLLKPVDPDRPRSGARPGGTAAQPRRPVAARPAGAPADAGGFAVALQARVSRAHRVTPGRAPLVHRPGPGDALLRRGQADVRRRGREAVLRGPHDRAAGDAAGSEALHPHPPRHASSTRRGSRKSRRSPAAASTLRLKDAKGTDLAVSRDRARAFKERLLGGEAG